VKFNTEINVLLQRVGYTCTLLVRYNEIYKLRQNEEGAMKKSISRKINMWYTSVGFGGKKTT
jgi:hypothetical protein